jgi:large subunit ribosomal protein L11
MQVKLLVEGGNMQPGPTLSQKLGPAGINVGQVIQKVNDITKDFKGMKVPVELDIDTNTKDIDVRVFSPPASELLKKELGIEKGSGEQKKMQVANASIEQIISVAKTKLPNLLSKDLKAAVKTVVGNCVSLGVLVESKPAVEVMREIEEGKYDREINEGRTETPEEKKKEMDEYFENLKSEQEKIRKQEEAAKASEAEKEGEEGEEKKEEEGEEEETEKKT